LLVAPRRDWIWYLVAGSATHFVAHWPQWTPSWILLAEAANITRALLAAVLLQRLFGGTPRLSGVGELTLFCAVAVMVAPAVAATIGAVNVVSHGAASSFGRPWLALFVSNSLTGLTMLPACLVAFEYAAARRRNAVAWPRVVEGLSLVVTLGVTCV